MAKRHNHYAKVDEKFVKTTILYLKWLENGDNVTLYYDKECKDPVYTDELEDLYLDGFEVCALPPVGISGVPKCYYKPGLCNADEGIAVALDFSGNPIACFTTKRPVDVNESNAIFYLEKMTLDGFEYNDTTSHDMEVYRNPNRDFEQPITPKTPLIAGETYIVNWDGIEYECVLEGVEGGFYLGLDYYAGASDGVHTFGLWLGYQYVEELGTSVPADIKVVFATTPETSHTISIYKMK